MITAKVVTLQAGHDHDKERAREWDLKLGVAYNVDRISMGQSSTTIHLVDYPYGFNSVFFEFYEDGKPLDIYADKRFNPYLNW